MANFSEGQQVRVPMFSASADNRLWGKEGVVVTVMPCVTMTQPPDYNTSVEQAYRERFDGEEEVETMYEGQLEAI